MSLVLEVHASSNLCQSSTTAPTVTRLLRSEMNSSWMLAFLVNKVLKICTGGSTDKSNYYNYWIRIDRIQLSHQMWRTWPNVSEQFWWPRLRWRSTKEIQRCWLTCSTAWPSLTPAHLSCARPGWTAWPESMWRMETCQRSVIGDAALSVWLNRADFGTRESNFTCDNVCDLCLYDLFKCQVPTGITSRFVCSSSCEVIYVHVISTASITLSEMGLFLLFTGSYVLCACSSACGRIPAEKRSGSLAHNTVAHSNIVWPVI